jgi:hypothetical protein
LFLLIYNQFVGLSFYVTMPPPDDEEKECVSNKEVRAMMKAMTELFIENQQPIDTTLERVERSFFGIID